jgi:hypothetical protein
MVAVTFDTHEFIKTLEASGISSEQAEATATAFQNAQQQSDIASKADIELLRSDVETQKAEVLGELKLNRWMIGLSIAISLGMLSLIIKIAIKTLV